MSTTFYNSGSGSGSGSGSSTSNGTGTSTSNDGFFDESSSPAFSVDNCVRVIHTGRNDRKDRTSADGFPFDGNFGALQQGDRLGLFLHHWKYIENKFNETFRAVNRPVLKSLCE